MRSTSPPSTPTTNNGLTGLGPELEIGAQLFPRYPLTLSWTSRSAAIVWRGREGRTSSFSDEAVGVGVFEGRTELLVGYRWTRIGSAPRFSGPTLGVRLWI